MSQPSFSKNSLISNFFKDTEEKDKREVNDI